MEAQDFRWFVGANHKAFKGRYGVGTGAITKTATGWTVEEWREGEKNSRAVHVVSDEWVTATEIQLAQLEELRAAKDFEEAPQVAAMLEAQKGACGTDVGSMGWDKWKDD